MPPPGPYIICSSPRSGSTMLSFALEDTRVAGCPREYFGPRLESGYARSWSLPKKYSLRAFIDAIVTHSMTANGVWALKIHLYDLVPVLERAKEEFGPSLEERALLQACFPDARYIFVHRQDRVRQAISFLRAMDSMEWVRHRGEPVADRMQRLEIDLDRIDPMVSLFAEQEDQWRAFFSRNDLTAYEVVYEDLVRDYDAVLLGALDHLGVRPWEGLLPIRPPRTERQSDHLTEVAMANYREREARSRGDLSIAGAARH
jgi:LPS sulfotransferase NodH